MLSQKKSMLLLMFSFVLLSLCLLFLPSTAHSSPSEDGTKKKPAPTLNAQGVYNFQITMGEPTKRFLARNEALLDDNYFLYSLIIGDLALPMEKRNQLQVEVRLKKDKRPLVFNNVLDIRAIGNSDYPKQGMTDMIMIIRSKDAAFSDYQQYQAIVSQLKQQGWVAYIPPMDARVFGEHSYIEDDELEMAPDPYYLDTLEKWQKYHGDVDSWRFYKNGVYIELSYNHYNVEEWGNATNKAFSMMIKTDFSEYFYGGNDDYESRDAQYAGLIKQQKKEWAQLRLLKEEWARGLPITITIDETYVNPPIPDKFDLRK